MQYVLYIYIVISYVQLFVRVQLERKKNRAREKYIKRERGRERKIEREKYI